MSLGCATVILDLLSCKLDNISLSFLNSVEAYKKDCFSSALLKVIDSSFEK